MNDRAVILALRVANDALRARRLSTLRERVLALETAAGMGLLFAPLPPGRMRRRFGRAKSR